MSAENPRPNPELFGQERIRTDLSTQLLRAQEFYKSPLITQAAFTINLALAEPPRDNPQQTNKQELRLRYANEGVVISRGLTHQDQKVTDRVQVIFPPEAFTNEPYRDYLTVTFHRSANLSQANVKETQGSILLVDLAGQEASKPDLTRVIVGPVEKDNATINRSQNGIGIDPSNPEAYSTYMDTVTVVTQELPIFDANFFDSIFVLPPTQ